MLNLSTACIGEHVFEVRSWHTWKRLVDVGEGAIIDDVVATRKLNDFCTKVWQGMTVFGIDYSSQYRWNQGEQITYQVNRLRCLLEGCRTRHWHHMSLVLLV